MPRVFDFLVSDDIPLLARVNYRLERNHVLGWGVVTGLIEGNTASIVVAKTFHASDLLIAVVLATPMLANLLSLAWGVLIRGRPRQRTFVLLAAATLIATMSVAFTPADWQPWGGWLFAAQVALGRTFLAGIVTLRSSMWSINYPTHLRATITGRIQGLRFLSALLATLSIMSLFSHDAALYRWVYPAVGLIGALSLIPAMRMRVRWERRELRAYRAARTRQERSFVAGLRESLGILQQDRAFARYCTAQYFLGSANLMLDAVLNIIVTKRLFFSTSGGPQPFDHLSASVVMDLLPNVVMLYFLPITSRQFDRVGVLRFRISNSAVWLASCAAATAAVALFAWNGYAATTAGLVVLGLARLLNGLGRSGGAVAWNLGHLHFARREQADLYMGIHVALTGLRGIIMPFVGLLAYKWLDWGALLIATILALVALEMFRRLAEAQGAAEEPRNGA